MHVVAMTGKDTIAMNWLLVRLVTLLAKVVVGWKDESREGCQTDSDGLGGSCRIRSRPGIYTVQATLATNDA